MSRAKSKGKMLVPGKGERSWLSAPLTEILYPPLPEDYNDD